MFQTGIWDVHVPPESVSSSHGDVPQLIKRPVTNDLGCAPHLPNLHTCHEFMGYM